MYDEDIKEESRQTREVVTAAVLFAHDCDVSLFVLGRKISNGVLEGGADDEYLCACIEYGLCSCLSQAIDVADEQFVL